MPLWALSLCVIRFCFWSTEENAKVGGFMASQFVSTNCPVVEAAADNSANTGDVKQAMLIHRDTMILAMQQNVRSQTQYKQEWLANLVTQMRYMALRLTKILVVSI